MNIFGVVIVDPFLTKEGDPLYPKFNKYLVEQINAINPKVVFICFESDDYKINQDLIDKIDCPIKSYFGSKEEWMKSGLLTGNWLYTGTHFQTCVHLNVLGLLNMFDVKRFNMNNYNDRFELFMRSDLTLHGNRTHLDRPEGTTTDSEVFNDNYCIWERLDTTPSYYKLKQLRAVQLNPEFQPRGNVPIYNETNPQPQYDTLIDRTNDKRLT